MKKILLSVLSLSLILLSCSKASTGPTNQNTALDTVTVNVTATVVPNISFPNVYAIVSTSTNPSISGLFASCSISYDVYDSTVLKYHKVSTQLQLPGTRSDTILSTFVKPVIQNIVVDTVNYSAGSVPAGYYLKFNY